MSLMNTILDLKIPNINKITESVFFKNQEEYIDLDVPSLNVAFSGKVKGGLTSGITIFFGESRTGKSLLALLCAAQYMKKYEDAVCVMIDSELGVNFKYFDLFGIDTQKIIHVPVSNVEEAKFNIVKIMENIKLGDHCVFVFDSIGNLASKKELDDAVDARNVSDLSRSKSIKSLFRIITPYFNMRNIPLLCVNHQYSTMDFIPQAVMSGGQGPLLSANNVFHLTKSKDRGADKELEGFKFKLKAYKSRSIRETSVFTLNIDFNKGIDFYSDLFEFAVESGFLKQETKQTYKKHEKYNDENVYKKKHFEFVEKSDNNIWNDFLNDPDFVLAYESKYALAKQKEEKKELKILENFDSDLSNDNESDSLISKQKKARGKK